MANSITISTPDFGGVLMPPKFEARGEYNIDRKRYTDLITCQVIFPDGSRYSGAVSRSPIPDKKEPERDSGSWTAKFELPAGVEGFDATIQAVLQVDPPVTVEVEDVDVVSGGVESVGDFEFIR